MQLFQRRVFRHTGLIDCPLIARPGQILTQLLLVPLTAIKHGSLTNKDSFTSSGAHPLLFLADARGVDAAPSLTGKPFACTGNPIQNQFDGTDCLHFAQCFSTKSHPAKTSRSREHLRRRLIHPPSPISLFCFWVMYEYSTRYQNGL